MMMTSTCLPSYSQILNTGRQLCDVTSGFVFIHELHYNNTFNVHKTESLISCLYEYNYPGIHFILLKLYKKTINAPTTTFVTFEFKSPLKN